MVFLNKASLNPYVWGVGWLAMNQVPTNWCIVSTQKVTKMFLPPPIFDYLIPHRPNLLKRRFSSVGAPDPSQTTRRIKSTESGGSKRVFTICSSAKKHAAKKRLVQNSGWKRKPTKKKHKTPKTPPKKSGVKKNPGIPGDVFQVWRWFRSFLCFYVLPPMIKKLGTHLFLCQPWSHLPHLGDRRPASKNHGCWFPWDSPPHLEEHPIQ